MRWAVVLTIAVPVVFGAGFFFARLGGNQELARSCIRAVRLVFTVEIAALVVVALFGLRYESRARQKDAAQFHPPGRLVDLGGYRLHLYCTGSGGPTVVLEHGHRATYLDWYLVQPKLAEFTRVCSFDRAGHGWSDPSPQSRLPSKMAEELRTLLLAAGEKPPYILVGHSFGGLDALMFAHKFPDQVVGVVLVDSPHPDILHRAPWQSRVWLRLMQFTMPFGLPRWRGWCDGGSQETLALKRALTCQPKNMTTILQEDDVFPAAAQEVRGISGLGSVPLVVIARDPASGSNPAHEARHTEQQRELAKLSSNARFVVAQGSGHDIPLATPDGIIEVVKTLLKPQAQAGSRGTP